MQRCFPRPRKCHGCCQSIAPNELVMRARNLIFHLGCFKCLVCDRQLNTGDEFGLGKDGLVYCRMHYFYHIQQQPQNMEHLHHISHQPQPHQSQHIQHQPFNSFYVDQNNQYAATNTYMDLSSSSSTSSTNSSSNYNLYSMGSNGNMPPTPGISPTANSISPSEQNVKGRPKKRKAGGGQNGANASANSSNNSMENGVAGTTGKKGGKSKQAKSTSAAKMEPSQISESKPSLENSVNSVIQQQQQHQANSSRVLSSGMLGSNGEDSPDDFKHNFDNNLGNVFIFIFLECFGWICN